MNIKIGHKKRFGDIFLPCAGVQFQFFVVPLQAEWAYCAQPLLYIHN